jgi:hypothetical protein
MSRAILTLCVLVAISCILCSCPKTTSVQKISQHNVVIVETWPFRGSSRRCTIRGAEGGPQAFTYERRNLKVRLENEVLTVNGNRYVIPRKDDSITIRNGHVEINGRPAKPEGTRR